MNDDPPFVALSHGFEQTVSERSSLVSITPPQKFALAD